MAKEFPEEIWKTLVQGGETYSRYKVSNYGRVWDLKTNLESAQNLTGIPQYYYVNLIDDLGERKGRRVNNIVSWTFHGKPPTKKHTSDHIDQDKLNNVEWNLRWADKRTQMINRSNTVRLPCGTPITEYIRYLGYEIDIGVGKYLLSRMRGGDTLLEAIFTRANYLQPYPLTWNDRGNNKGIEYENTWYPNTKSLLKFKGNCGINVYQSRKREGKSIEEALTYMYDASELHRFELNGFNMTREVHCERLQVSIERITSYMSKHNITFEEAVKLPVQRIIKHNINGVTKRNTDWYEKFNIPARTANSWMVRKKKDGSPSGRTFRDVLEKYNIDTTGWEIYPCDGEVVMKNKPI